MWSWADGLSRPARAAGFQVLPKHWIVERAFAWLGCYRRLSNRHLSGWTRGVMADTRTSISRRRTSAPALVNPAYTSQIDSRTCLLQGQRKWDRFHCLDGVVPDADANAACNIPARLYDEEITLYTPFREVKALLAERIRLSVGTARPGLELRGPATAPPSTESEVPALVPECTS